MEPRPEGSARYPTGVAPAVGPARSWSLERRVLTPASKAALRLPPPRGWRLPWRELRREPGGPEEGPDLTSSLESLASIREGAQKVSQSVKMPSTPDNCIIEV